MIRTLSLSLTIAALSLFVTAHLGGCGATDDGSGGGAGARQPLAVASALGRIG